jgi:hypothetical protein
MSGDAQLAYFLAAGAEIALVRDLQRYTLSVGVELVKRDGLGSTAMTGLDEYRSNRMWIGISVPAGGRQDAERRRGDPV